MSNKQNNPMRDRLFPFWVTKLAGIQNVCTFMLCGLRYSVHSRGDVTKLGFCWVLTFTNWIIGQLREQCIWQALLCGRVLLWNTKFRAWEIKQPTDRRYIFCGISIFADLIFPAYFQVPYILSSPPSFFVTVLKMFCLICCLIKGKFSRFRVILL